MVIVIGALLERLFFGFFVSAARIWQSATHQNTIGAQETDGLAVTPVALGPQYPEGLLVVQDGFNAPKGSTQNFKYIDWRKVPK